MSLTSRINGSDARDRELQDILRSTLPPKNLFATVSGTKVFAGSQYVARAPYALPNRSYSGVVGTAFDYLARVIVARTIDDHKDDCFKMLVAESGLRLVQRQGNDFGSAVMKDVADTYHRATTCLANYAYRSGGATLEGAISSCCKLARFEYIARNSLMAESPWSLAPALNYITTAEPVEISQDLERLADVFARSFISSGIVNSNSFVVFNPKFLAAEIGGADADMMVDSVLYDFKTSKSPGYKWQDIAQLWGYYLLSELRGIYDGRSLQSAFAPVLDRIHRLALYKARYGEIEYVDIDELDEAQTRTAIRLLGEYLDRK